MRKRLRQVANSKLQTCTSQGFVNPFSRNIGNFVSTLKILTLVLNPLILYLTGSVHVIRVGFDMEAIFIFLQVKLASALFFLHGLLQAVHKFLNTSVTLMLIVKVDNFPCVVKIAARNEFALVKSEVSRNRNRRRPTMCAFVYYTVV